MLAMSVAIFRPASVNCYAIIKRRHDEGTVQEREEERGKVGGKELLEKLWGTSVPLYLAKGQAGSCGRLRRQTRWAVKAVTGPLDRKA
jgi:hypothetical protein